MDLQAELLPLWQDDHLFATQRFPAHFHQREIRFFNQNSENILVNPARSGKFEIAIWKLQWFIAIIANKLAKVSN